LIAQENKGGGDVLEVQRIFGQFVKVLEGEGGG
jgi:hypothetical protein